MGMDVRAGAAGLLLTTILATGTVEPAEPDKVTDRLSPETRALLIQEMQAIDAAMGRIHSALVTGDHATVSDEAQAVHDSFVLAQALGPEQREEIHSLPGPFLDADEAFHELAIRLADAGAEEDAHLERVWYDEMTRACLSCHRKFAAGRFSGLTSEQSR